MIKAVIFDMYETLITLFECPVYFGTQMAIDAGIDVDDFLRTWSPAEGDRSIGKVSFEQMLENVLRENNRYSKDVFNRIVNKRIETKKESFNHLHKEIIPMIKELKKRNIKVGLISNCFSEEAIVIRESELFSYFDAVCLSYEEGIKKPDEEIYARCMYKLGVSAKECIYVGDGGSMELEAAQKIGMRAVQAVWYMKEGTSQPTGRKKGFEQIETPLGVVKLTL